MPLNPRETVIEKESSALERLRCSERHRDIGKSGSWSQPPKVAWIGAPHSARGLSAYYSKLLAALQSPEALSERLSAVEQKCSALQAIVEKFQAAIEGPKAPSLGEFDRWLASEEAKKFAGQHVAWLPQFGVLKIAPTADALIAALEGNPDEENVSIAIVPTWQAVKA